MTAKRVMLVVTERLAGEELFEELRREAADGETSVVVVAPAIEATRFEHALGGAEGARRSARLRLASCLEELRRHGIAALGEVGPSDPVEAAAAALHEYPSDEVVLVTHPPGTDLWYEEGLYERACATLHAPVRQFRTS